MEMQKLPNETDRYLELIDLESLDKGHTIPVDICEKVLGLKYGSQEFSFALMGLSARIKEDLEARGRMVITRTSRGSIRISENEEGMVYKARMMALCDRAKERHFRDFCTCVDRNTLSEEVQSKYDRERECAGKQILNNRRERQQILGGGLAEKLIE